MPLFQRKQKNVVGIDIGTTSIKMIELSRHNESFSLVTYGFVEGMQPHKGSEKERMEILGKQLERIREQAKFTTQTAVAALPTHAVFSSIISLPHMDPKELDSAIRWEAKKIIPLPLEDIVLDSKILNQADKKNPEKELEILITGAPRDMIKRYTELFTKHDFKLASIETETIALSRSLVGMDTAEVMVVEMGSATTDIIIIQNGIPLLTRSIDQGGGALTRSIMQRLNINEKRAEQLKRDIGITTLGGDKEGGVPEILKEAIEPIEHEIRYTLDLYKEQESKPLAGATGDVEKIVLTGGAAMMPSFAEYMASKLDMRVIVGDPWSQVSYAEDLRPVLAGIGSKFSVAIGLAMHEIE